MHETRFDLVATPSGASAHVLGRTVDDRSDDL
jgi:hypothetical protein